MTSWPKDHPGRNCGLCGSPVYRFWIDDTPPPGTCVEKCSAARDCHSAVETLISSFSIAKLEGRAPHQKTLERMRLMGFTEAEVWAELDLRDRTVAKQRELWDTDAIQIQGKPLHEWLDEGDILASLPALFGRIAGLANLVDGKRSIAEIEEMGAALRRRCFGALENLGAVGDYEPGGVED